MKSVLLGLLKRIVLTKLIYIFLVTSIQIYSQSNDVVILKYSGKEKNRTKETDSSIIETKFFPDFGYIGVFNDLKKEKKTYYKKYDYSTRILIEEGVWINGNNAGLWKYYSTAGKLEKTINYDNGETKQFSGEVSLYKEYFDFIKNKADSILIENLGPKFYKNNILWNASKSYYYGPSLSARWFEETDIKPNIFLLRYEVILENDLKFPLIEFYVDSIGRLTHRFSPNDTKGIRRCNETSKECTFNITIEKATALAKENGMKMEKNKYFIYLEYNPNEKSSDLFGEYELIVADYDKSETKNNENLDYYNGLVINPWTGKIKEKILLTQNTISHKYSSFQSGLKRVK